VRKPENLTFEQAAAVPMAGLTALQALRDAGRLQPGQKVLVNGASGGIGTFAVQIAKSFGAEVTGVCSTKNPDLVASIGADRVIDYTRDDFTASGRRYDLILDTANRSLADCRRALTPHGTLVPIGGSGGRWIEACLPAQIQIGLSGDGGARRCRHSSTANAWRRAGSA
jgi:NADPH:quinone reductase-like Zn-dependent oxidoreductase